MNRAHQDRLRRGIALAVLMATSGCHRYLVDTPNVLHRQDPRQYYAACPSDCRTPVAPILYATDRTIDAGGADNPRYGFGRSNNLTFGSAEVALRPDPSWAELIKDSTQLKRGKDYELKLAAVRESGEIKTNWNSIVPESGGDITRVAAQQIVQERSQVHDLLQRRLDQSPRKDVYIFVHGYNTSFESAIFRTAEIWHFLGRVGVPIAYSWPAGRGGVRGYAYDRESGEFTVSHLRGFLKRVAECPGVERIHLIGHSRGADVVASALRELHLSYLAQGKSTRHELKLANLVLAAPDIDADVFKQRFVAENLFTAAERTTIYVSNTDRAIEAADIVFASQQRVGGLAIKDISAKVRQALARLPNVQLIECKLGSWTLNHAYVFSNPAAMSDLILVLRDGRAPGAAHGRPLEQPVEGVWELNDRYLAGTK